MSNLFQSPESLSRADRPGPRKKGPKIGRPKPPGESYNPDELVTYHVKFAHKINGQWYSGVVQVPRQIADFLADCDSRATAEQANFYRTDKAVVIGPRLRVGNDSLHTTKEVPAALFATVVSQAEQLGLAADEQIVTGMTDPGAAKGLARF